MTPTLEEEKKKDFTIKAIKVIKITFLILAVLIVLVMSVAYYYNQSINRGCGFNPINHLKAAHNELWCFCNESQYYGGFSCLSCSQFCDKYNLGISK